MFFHQCVEHFHFFEAFEQEVFIGKGLGLCFGDFPAKMLCYLGVVSNQVREIAKGVREYFRLNLVVILAASGIPDFG